MAADVIQLLEQLRSRIKKTQYGKDLTKSNPEYVDGWLTAIGECGTLVEEAILEFRRTRATAELRGGFVQVEGEADLHNPDG